MPPVRLPSRWISRVCRLAGAACAVFLAGTLLVASARAEGEKRPRKTPSPPASVPGSVAPVPVAPDSVVPLVPGADSARRKPVAYDLVRFGQNFHIHADEVVRGDVVLLGGDLRVEGEIAGGAVALGGNIEIGPKARIGGEAISVGGRVDAAVGADVQGGSVSLSFLPTPLIGGADWQRAQRIGAVLGDLVQTAVLVLFAILCAVFGARPLQRAGDEIGRSLWRSLGLGILSLTGGLFSVVMLIVLLALTLVGLPLGLLLALGTLLFLGAALFVGLTRLGAWLGASLRLRSRSIRTAALLGVLAYMSPKILADLLRVANSDAVGTPLRFVHGALTIAALAAGLGALVLSRLGARGTAVTTVRRYVVPTPAIAPPPGPATAD